MTAPEGFTELREDAAVGWVATDLAAAGLAPYFGPLQPLPGAKGRGGVGVLELGGREIVVRPFRRGGALGSLLKDRYGSTRRVRDEIETLLALREQGVPAVVPIAAVWKRHGAFWRLRLGTERVPGAMPLPAFLAAEPGLRRRTAVAVGTMLKLAFDAGLRHPDLHLDNVLCAAREDRVRAVLVDLDRARLKAAVPQKEVESMLVRMGRYVVKHRPRMAAVPTRSEELRMLLALGVPRAELQAMYRRLARKLRRAVKGRNWLRGASANARVAASSQS
ncbi:MAG: hypothetical protein NXI31_11660 [bacterium]|nr:hypothetical protein [bacterium]